MSSRKALKTTNDPIEAEAKAILAKPYARRLTPDESGGYTATIQEFPGCIAEGDTPNEALNNLEDAAASWIQAQLALGQTVPEPLALYGYSGKIALRIPRGLHKRVAEMAQSDGVSVNQFLTNALATFVGAKSVADKVIEQLRPTLEMQIRTWLTSGGGFTAMVLHTFTERTNSASQNVRIFDNLPPPSRHAGQYSTRQIVSYTNG
ncbi:antitoxin HicB [Dyella jiangningensis]|nr:antitoxin HicB [Dyella jiangningensis]